MIEWFLLVAGRLVVRWLDHLRKDKALLRFQLGSLATRN
jgi:hypothetical protein